MLKHIGAFLSRLLRPAPFIELPVIEPPFDDDALRALRERNKGRTVAMIKELGSGYALYNARPAPVTQLGEET